VQRIYIPCDSAEQWKRYLAEASHWRTGYSARSLAYCWHDPVASERGLPSEVAVALDRVPQLQGLEVLFAIPEHEVALPGGSRASQTDLWFLGSVAHSTVSVAVEGKVKESFGPTVAEWLSTADSKSGKPKRLAALREILGISKTDDLGSIRYQLLHRTASAVLEARRFKTSAAVMLVHSFAGTKNFDQYREFTGLFGTEVRAASVVQLSVIETLPLYVGWIKGDPKWLRA
jgi:hypothetical protein